MKEERETHYKAKLCDGLSQVDSLPKKKNLCRNEVASFLNEFIISIATAILK